MLRKQSIRHQISEVKKLYNTLPYLSGLIIYCFFKQNMLILITYKGYKTDYFIKQLMIALWISTICIIFLEWPLYSYRNVVRFLDHSKWFESEMIFSCLSIVMGRLYNGSRLMAYCLLLDPYLYPIALDLSLYLCNWDCIRSFLKILSYFMSQGILHSFSLSRLVDLNSLISLFSQILL